MIKIIVVEGFAGVKRVFGWEVAVCNGGDYSVVEPEVDGDAVQIAVFRVVECGVV